MARMYSKRGTMSSETKNFIQKICYKKSASIDMTRYGFLKDSKLLLINLMLKPLKEQLEKIWGIKSNRNKTARKPSPSRRNDKDTPTIISVKLLKSQKGQKMVKPFRHEQKNDLKNRC